MEIFRSMHPGRRGRGLSCLLAVLLGSCVVLAHGPIHERLAFASRQIEEDPENGDLFTARAALYLEHRDFPAALVDLKQAEALGTGGATIPLLRAKALSGQGKHDEALDVVSAWLAATPASADGYVVRAEILERLGRFRPAAADLAAAIRHVSKPNVDLYLKHARLLEQCGDQDAAIQCLEQGRAKLTRSVVLQVALCELTVRAGRFEDALPMIDALIAASPRKERWLASRADVLSRLGRESAAMEASRDALVAIEKLPARHRGTPAVVSLEKQLRQRLVSAAR